MSLLWGKKRRASAPGEYRRLRGFSFFIGAFFALMIFRLFNLQVLQMDFYSAMASDQRDVLATLFPARGEIFIQDKGGKRYALATNEDRFLVYADTRKVNEKKETAEKLAAILGLDIEEVSDRIFKENDPFEPIAKSVTEVKVNEIKAAELSGIFSTKEPFRFYPMGNIASQVVGFVGEDKSGRREGRYGVESYFEKSLHGYEGVLQGERDVAGRFIPIGIETFEEAKDGQDVVLTLDRNIEYVACEKLNDAVAKHGADGGSVVIMEAKTGRVLAMCGAPDFDPNTYAQAEHPEVFNNPAIFNQYEPGSIFKVITLAAALDTGAVDPETTFEDTGAVTIGPHIIKNSDGGVRGIQTMTQALEQSLNTGMIFAVRKTGFDKFREYVERFGFGKPTGIELPQEATGDTSALLRKGEIYFATASFGQGVSVTPIQMAAAVGAVANGGKLMKPYIIDRIESYGAVVEERFPQMVRQAMSPQTAALLSGMMVRVVENGHGKRAGVKGYFVAGKTGTAQIPKKNGLGYDPNATIGSFVGFAPVDDPKFVMLVRIDNPKDVKFAESTAAPLFGDIAEFLLQYLEVKPTRETK
ncbi:MAG: penicillin-binding protein 2 [Patescibacteria group bacterium]